MPIFLSGAQMSEILPLTTIAVAQKGEREHVTGFWPAFIDIVQCQCALSILPSPPPNREDQDHGFDFEQGTRGDGHFGALGGA